MKVLIKILGLSLILLKISTQAAFNDGGESCDTPEGPGQCVELHQCDYIQNMMRIIASYSYVLKFNCADNHNDLLSKVCCPDRLQTKSILKRSLPLYIPIADSVLPYPDGSQCGLNMDLDRKGPDVYSIADIDQYPWLALIEYKKANKIKQICTGALISSQYVVTAAHCVLGPVTNAGQPTNVRLGDYDISNNGGDSIVVDGGGTHRNDPIVIAIESILVHGDYSPVDSLRRHDIALIRLQTMVTFTEFIQPICLPTTDISDDVTLVSAGWGSLNDLHFGSDVIRHTGMPFVNRESCQSHYSINLWSGQVCAGGVPGRDSCVADSGSPLIHQNKSTGRFELYGLHTFGPRPCSVEDVPLVYTKVLEYNSWINFHTKKSCTTSRGKSGQCMEESESLANKMITNSIFYDRLEYSIHSTCEFSGSKPMICCENQCPTVDESGQCSSVYTCPYLTDTGSFNVTTSRCSGPQPYQLCCNMSQAPLDAEPESTTFLPDEPHCNLGAEPPDPSLGCCGRNAETEANFLTNRISGGKTTDIYSYPWLADLEYSPSDSVICGGSLITGKHVLTAAHCISSPEIRYKNITVSHVRLGDYNIINEGPDCITSSSGLRICNDGAISVPIRTALPHQDYNDRKIYDIAIIELSYIVKYTNFIRPICLPTTDVIFGNEKVLLYAAGWGYLNDTIQERPKFKQAVTLPLYDTDMCRRKLWVDTAILLVDSQFCAGGVLGLDTCGGDSGGPLMRLEGNTYELVGITSFGQYPCGGTDYPGVYTKVFAYLEWIQEMVNSVCC